MLCSNCSHEIKPVVAIDIDGTLGDYHGHFALFAWQYHNMPVRMGFWAGDGDFETWLGLTRAEYREAKLAYRQGGGKRLMPVMSGALYLLDTLHSAGAEVWLTTTRPWMRHDSTDPDTRNWLDRHNLPYDHLLYDDDKYMRLGELVDVGRVVYILDDLPAQYDRAEEIFGERVWLRQNNYNTACWKPRVAPNLYAAASTAVVNIKEWYAIDG